MLNSYVDGSTVTVLMRGELDHFCATTVRRELDALISDAHIRWLVLDFSQVQFMDSSGIGVILGRYRQLRERGGGVAIMRMNDQLRRIVRLSGLDRVIRILDNTEVAK